MPTPISPATPYAFTALNLGLLPAPGMGDMIMRVAVAPLPAAAIRSDALISLNATEKALMSAARRFEGDRLCAAHRLIHPAPDADPTVISQQWRTEAGTSLEKMESEGARSAVVEFDVTGDAAAVATSGVLQGIMEYAHTAVDEPRPGFMREVVVSMGRPDYEAHVEGFADLRRHFGLFAEPSSPSGAAYIVIESQRLVARHGAEEGMRYLLASARSTLMAHDRASARTILRGAASMYSPAPIPGLCPAFVNLAAALAAVGDADGIHRAVARFRDWIQFADGEEGRDGQRAELAMKLRDAGYAGIAAELVNDIEGERARSNLFEALDGLFDDDDRR
jgi:hypothetical protein